MSKAAINFLLDAALFVMYGAVVASTVVVRFVFPSAVETAGWSLWSLDYNTWCNVQAGSIAFFTFGVVIHVILHWGWICGFVATHWPRRDRKPVQVPDGIRTLYGVGLLITVVTVMGMFLAVAVVMIEAPAA